MARGIESIGQSSHVSCGAREARPYRRPASIRCLARARDANRVVILDTTMRDGERSPGCSLNLEVKAAR